MNGKTMFLGTATLLAATMSASANTVAYWPMNVSGPADAKIVADSSGNGYNLNCRAPAAGTPAFSDNDIGWTLPPNPDAVGVESEQKVLSSSGAKTDGYFWSVFSCQDEGLVVALAADRDWTLEGWFRATALPTSGQQMLAYNALGKRGGWAILIMPTDANGYIPVTIDFNRTGSRQDVVLNTKLRPAELLNKWNHFAMVFDSSKDGASGKSEWRLYLNGHLRAATESAQVSGAPDVAGQNFFLSGGKGGSDQTLKGDLTCWRASDAALAPGEFLCDHLSGTTVAYWPMGGATLSDGTRIVPSAVNASGDLTARVNYATFSENDIGWTVPPNPDDEADESQPWLSDEKVAVAGGWVGEGYKPAFKSVNASLIAALTPTNSFTLEGWFRPTALPASATFATLTLAEYGGWMLTMGGADANGKCKVSMAVAANRTTPGNRTEFDLGRIPSAELQDAWCHFALAFDLKTNGFKFYCNGRLIGGYVLAHRFADVGFSDGRYLMVFGTQSSSDKSPVGDASTWRVSAAALEPVDMLLGAAADMDELVWTGASDNKWGVTTTPNWQTADTSPVASAWQDFCRAKFVGGATVSLATEVNPTEVLIDTDADVTFTTGNSSYCIGRACRRIVKRGTGTAWFKPNEKTVFNKSSNRIDVEKGTLRVSGKNGQYGLGDATSEDGYSVFVQDGAGLLADEANVCGNSSPTTANNSHITVLTNGIFDLAYAGTPASGWINLQALGTLDLLGGTVNPPQTGHYLGMLMIRDRVTFGLNPDRTPYAFEPAPSGAETDHQGWLFGKGTEFRVEDITGDAAADVVFNCNLLSMKSWQETGTSFRKTGAGTMAVNRKNRSNSDAIFPTDVCSVEEGVLEINCNYPADFRVGQGACLAGVGTVRSVAFAEGAVVSGVMGRAETLAVSGACTFAATGTVALTDPQHLNRTRTRLLTLNGEVSGAENLKNWSVTVDGEAVSDYQVCIRNGVLVARRESGLSVIIR